MNHLKKRNIALAAAYTTIDTTFKDYRERVIERFGEEVDKQLKYGIKAVEVEKDIEDEDGEIAFVVIAQMDVMNNYKIIKNINIDEDEDSGKNHSHLLNPDHMIANSEFFTTYEEAEKFLNKIIKD